MITFKYLIIPFFHKTALLSFKIRLLLHAYHIFFPYNRLILQTSPTYVWHFVFQMLSRLSKRLSFWILLLQTYFLVINVIRIHFISSWCSNITLSILLSSYDQAMFLDCYCRCYSKIVFFLFCFPLIIKLIRFWLLELRRCTTYAQDKALMCLWCCLSLVKHIHNINGWIISIPVSMAHKIKRKDTTT